MRLLFWSLHSLVSHWRRHPLQLAGLVAGLWLATALLIGVLALNAQARQSYAQASALFGADQSSLEARDGKRFTQALFVELRRQGWPVSPVLQSRLTLAEREGTLPLLGIEPVSLPSDQGAAAGASPTALYDFLSPAGTTWIAPETLREWQLQAGQVLHRVDGLPLPPLQPRPDLAPGTLVLDIGQAQRLLDAPDQLSRLILPKTFQRALPTLAGVDLHRVENDQGAELDRLTDSFHLNLLALGLLAFAVGLFIVHAATGLALEQRRALLRTLRACGLSAATLVLALTLELALIALVAGALGVASGYLLAALLLPDVAASLRGLYGAEIAGSLTLSWPGGWPASASAWVGPCWPVPMVCGVRRGYRCWPWPRERFGAPPMVAGSGARPWAPCWRAWQRWPYGWAARAWPAAWPCSAACCWLPPWRCRRC